MPKRHITMRCKYCKSANVFRDAWAEWSDEDQDWILQNVFDDGYCESCGDDSHIVERYLHDLSPVTTRDRYGDDT